MSNQTSSFRMMDYLSKWIMRPKLGNTKQPGLWPSSPAAITQTIDDKNKIITALYGSCRRQIFLQYVMQLFPYSMAFDKKYQYLESVYKDIKTNYNEPDKYHMWLFDSADRYEEYMIEHVKESGIYIGSQVPIYIPHINLSGKIDIIINDPITFKKIIVEVKSVYSFGGTEVLGKNFDRFNNFSGKPRTKNLMQLALYQWWFAGDNEGFDNARLVYGDRGSGKYAEYEVKVNKQTGIIEYRCIDPVETKWFSVPYTVFDIIKVYKYILKCVEDNVLPERDFTLKYSDEQLASHIEKDYIIKVIDKDDEVIKEYDNLSTFLEDGKNFAKSRKFFIEPKDEPFIKEVVAEQYIKYKDRLINGGKKVKAPSDGDWECSVCSFRQFCYDQNKEPRQ